MQDLQKHIINKLTVDVETQNPRTAFYLKDNIDTFLKNEILPDLEDYFSSITEDLHSHTIQIPYLSVNVDTSSVLNYKELKEDVRKEIIKEIKQITNPLKAVENDVVFIKRNESKEESILHFLEQGTNSWWIGSEDTFHFDNEEFCELLESQNFQSKLRQKLLRKQVQNRFISQLNNEQIRLTLQTVFQSSIGFLLVEDLIKNIEKLNLKSRATIWEYLIDFAINENKDSLATKLIFELSELIPEVKKENTKKRKIIEETSSVKKKVQEKLMIRTIISILAKVHKAKETELTSDVIDLITMHKAYYDEILGLNIEESILNDVQTEKISEQVDDTHNKVTSTSNNSIENLKTAQSNTSNGQATIENAKTIEQKNEEESKKALHKNRDDKEKDISLKNEESGLSVDQIKTVEKEASEVLDIEFKDAQNLEKETPKNIERESTQADIVSNDFEKNHKDVEKQLEENKRNLSQTNNEFEEVTDGKSEVEENSKTIAITRSKEKDYLTKEGFIPSSKKLKKAMSNLIKEKDRTLLQKHKTRSEEKEENEVLKGEYQINNAGLILLHPYLGHFFKNCNVLNENNEIVNPDLAVHLLHYLATKQEQQFESNMLFEKILCGVPLKKTIQRNIELPDELKSNAEELLQAVLDNWGVLKNASPDLLRGEFLQRFGKISFKDANPKITIERKVYDILLEKLPWNIGISRLPWLDYLLFTDW